jgi:hypothetical protein
MSAKIAMPIVILMETPKRLAPTLTVTVTKITVVTVRVYALSAWHLLT